MVFRFKYSETRRGVPIVYCRVVSLLSSENTQVLSLYETTISFAAVGDGWLILLTIVTVNHLYEMWPFKNGIIRRLELQT